MCIWNPLSSLLYIALDEKHMQTWIIHKDTRTLFERLMIPAHLNVIKSEFITMCRQNRGEAIALTPRGYGAPPGGDSFLAVTWSRGGVVFWRPRHHGGQFCWDMSTTRLLSLPPELPFHPNLLFSLVYLLNCFVSITLETLKRKKKKHSDRSARLIGDSRTSKICWLPGQKWTAPDPFIAHLPHSVWTCQTLKPAWLITLPKNLRNKVHMTRKPREGPSEVRIQDQTKLICLPQSSSYQPQTCRLCIPRTFPFEVN